MVDLVNAHRKLILATITAILPQFVDGQTADSIIIAVGLILTLITGNDQAAVERVYRKPRHA